MLIKDNIPEKKITWTGVNFYHVLKTEESINFKELFSKR